MAQPVISKPGYVTQHGNMKFDPKKVSSRRNQELGRFLRTQGGTRIKGSGGRSKFF